MLGLGRESITGIMPLYLFEEHWIIAKRKLQPLFGFMCTLDVLGYSTEQLFTVPFLALLKAYTKVAEEPTEVNQRMLSQIELTCMKLIETRQDFRNEIITKFVNFGSKQERESHRTADIIKSIPVFAA